MAKASRKTATAVRRHPHEGRKAERPGVSIAPAAAAFRTALRAPAASAPALSKALGVKLPQQPKTSATNGSCAALWLGPDEWLVIDTGGSDPIAACAGAKVLHSAVDISHRNTAILVSGRHSAQALNAGCPQDLSLQAFPVGACSRTVLGKVEIVLWRTDADAFRVECWRSFSDYVFTFLEEAARDAAA